MGDFNYEVVEKFGTLSDKNGWSKEVNLISYNGASAKYDIRSWQTDENGDRKMSKGITLTKEEVKELRQILNAIDLD